MNSTIDVLDLTASYGMGNVLNGISFQIDPGEFVGVYGRSGCGKSTLLHVLGGLHRDFSGSVNVTGVDVSNSSEDELLTLRRDHIGFVFQQSFLISEMTLRENVEFPLLLQKIGREERTHRVNEVLNHLDLHDCQKQLPAQLSGGQKQRGAIARAMVARPKVLLVDEPTGALDQANGREVLLLLKELARESGTSVLMVSHDEIALRSADRLIHLVDGTIVAAENFSNLKTGIK